MSKKAPQTRSSRRPSWGWLLPVLLCAPLALGAKGCNTAVVGDDCPDDGVSCSGGASGQDGSCGGLLGLACPAAQFCDYAVDAQCGFADQTGVCASRPEACDAQYEPVCGCDGFTYGNACEAAAAGMSVATEGACDAPAEPECGGLLGLTCPAGQFCDFPPNGLCGSADQTGTCREPPAGCDDADAPVCGCDGQTYVNACEAAVAAISVASQGSCEPAGGEVCGGLRGMACPEGQYCSFPADAMCGIADAPGTCREMPKGCSQQYNPVCGCDGTTHDNECLAASVGVSAAQKGTCEAEPPPKGGQMCGGLLGVQCGEGMFCNFPPDQPCGFSDASGVCNPSPVGCPKDVAPVCACDGQTYGNACLANAAGSSVLTTGSCD